MKNEGTFAVAERWTEHRTDRGRWSTVKQDYQVWRYKRSQLDMVLEDHRPGERRSSYVHTNQGYFPSRIVEPHPSGEYRTVIEFTFRGQDDFLDLLIDSLEDN